MAISMIRGIEIHILFDFQQTVMSIYLGTFIRILGTLTSLIMENKDEKSKTFYLKVRDLDSFQQKIEFCLFGINLDLKVDIEGHELEALPEWMESGALEKVLQFKIGLMPSITVSHGAPSEQNSLSKEVRSSYHISYQSCAIIKTSQISVKS